MGMIGIRRKVLHYTAFIRDSIHNLAVVQFG